MAEFELFERAARMRTVPKAAGFRPKLVSDWKAANWTLLDQPHHTSRKKQLVGRRTILEKILVTGGHFARVPWHRHLKHQAGLL